MDNGYVNEGEYVPTGTTYSYVLLNAEAKEEMYKSLSPNPQIAIELVSGYNYVSLANSKTLCESTMQNYDGNYTAICDQNNTLDSTFGVNTNIDAVLKHEESWQYWDSNSTVNPIYRMSKFSMLNPLSGVVVKTSAATTLYLPYDDDAQQINDYAGMSSQKWYLLSNNKKQTVTEITTSASPKTIEYIMVYRHPEWHIYSPIHDSSIDPNIPRITEIYRHESFWISFQ